MAARVAVIYLPILLNNRFCDLNSMESVKLIFIPPTIYFRLLFITTTITAAVGVAVNWVLISTSLLYLISLLA
jgi:hypothetical protein